MKLWILIMFAALLLAPPVAATAAVAHSSPELAAVATTLAGQPIQVHETAGAHTWQGNAFVGQPEIWLSQLAYRQAQRGNGYGVFALLHETRHTMQTPGMDTAASECEADGWAQSHLASTLRNFWHETPARVKREVAYADAFEKYPC